MRSDNIFTCTCIENLCKSLVRVMISMGIGDCINQNRIYTVCFWEGLFSFFQYTFFNSVNIFDSRFLSTQYANKNKYLIAMLLDLRWFQRWFISSSRRCSITASSCDVNEPRSFRPVPSSRSYTTRCVSISDWRSWK